MRHRNAGTAFHFLLRPARTLLFLCAPFAAADAQSPEPLDPTVTATLTAPSHAPLPEQFLWTAGDVTTQRPDHNKFPWNRPDLRIAPHDFRARFQVTAVPPAATLYIAGPREATVYLNGQPLGHFASSPDQPINFRVFHVSAAAALHTGDNVLAIHAVRGRGVVSNTSNPALQQLAYGEVLAVKLLPAAFGDASPKPVLVSDLSWRSQPSHAPTDSAWYLPTLDDSSWPKVQSLGAIDSDMDFLQWSADAGMYGWPGYIGMSAPLRTYALPAAQILHVFSGSAQYVNLDSLKLSAPSAPFTIEQSHGSAAQPTDAEAPSLLLDFGREVAGRILVESDSSADSLLSVAYGESELEAMATGLTPMARGGHYLGTNLLDIPAHGVARGPKSAFRYVRISFLRTPAHAKFPAIRLEGITYPVAQRATFTSSDPLLNRIYETAAYTAHLCMQDGVWDAPKRDRGRWAGDLDIETPVIYSAFGDTAAVEDTLARLARDTAPNHAVNGIPSYTALWLTTVARLYQFSGNKAFVAAQHDNILSMLARLDADRDPATGLLKPTQRGWGFVDWSPGLYANTPEVLTGTTLQYLRAYQAAPALLRAAGDEANANHYSHSAERLAQAARDSFFPPGTHTLGVTWQLNTLAVLTGISSENTPAIWSSIFAPTDPVISPYFNAYLLDAMTLTGHSQEALNWMRTYWGGMLAEGATSFWESYDLRWQKSDFHLGLQADGTSGFFVSLAHGWSAGPVPWIAENILGVRPLAPGYSSVAIHPQLLGLTSARGTVPTPHGMISVAMDSDHTLTLDLPSGVETAELTLPSAATQVLLNGTAITASLGATSRTSRQSSPPPIPETPILHLTRSGHYTLSWK